MQIGSQSFWPVPVVSGGAGYAGQIKARRDQTGSGLRVQRIGYEPLVAERRSNTPRGPVECGACVRGSIGAIAAHLKRQSIILSAGNRSADNSHPDKPAILICNADREFVTGQPAMVPVIPLNKGVRLIKRYWDNVQPGLPDFLSRLSRRSDVDLRTRRT